MAKRAGGKAQAEELVSSRRKVQSVRSTDRIPLQARLFPPGSSLPRMRASTLSKGLDSRFRGMTSFLPAELDHWQASSN